MEGRMLSSAGFSSASGVLAVATLVIVFALAALLAGWVLRTVRKEQSARVAAERASAQSHRLAQSTAAFGQVSASADAIATAVHEPLHWLRAAAGVF